MLPLLFSLIFLILVEVLVSIASFRATNLLVLVVNSLFRKGSTLSKYLLGLGSFLVPSKILVPCFKRCKPKAFPTACPIVDKGKYPKSFIRRLPWVLTPELES